MHPDESSWVALSFECICRSKVVARSDLAGGELVSTLSARPPSAMFTVISLRPDKRLLSETPRRCRSNRSRISLSPPLRRLRQRRKRFRRQGARRRTRASSTRTRTRQDPVRETRAGRESKLRRDVASHSKLRASKLIAPALIAWPSLEAGPEHVESDDWPLNAAVARCAGIGRDVKEHAIPLIDVKTGWWTKLFIPGPAEMAKLPPRETV